VTERVVLGRTGLRVHPAGLGCGGNSRLGQSRGASVEESVAVVRRALELGVNFIDTAPVYGTEEIVGRALAGRRDDAVLSTKALAHLRKGRVTGAELGVRIEKSLTRLGTDRIDVFHLHAVPPKDYDYCLSELVPVMLRMREQGKIRFLGITENFLSDTGHATLSRAVRDDCWDVMMVGFNIVNPSARTRVLAAARENEIGILAMFAVRRALARPRQLAKLMRSLRRRGRIPDEAFDRRDPLGFLVREGGAGSVVEAAYRFCRHEPGVHVVLTGTGNLAHLEENMASIGRGPLRAADLRRLEETFGAVDSVSGD
jgi:L-galactose dehydrogenase